MLMHDLRPDRDRPPNHGWGAVHTWDQAPGASLKATIAEGTTTAEVLNEFLQLAEDEVREALRIAAAVDEHGLLPRGIR